MKCSISTRSSYGLAYYLLRRIRSLQARKKQQPGNVKVARLLQQAKSWRQWVLEQRKETQ